MLGGPLKYPSVFASMQGTSTATRSAMSCTATSAPSWCEESLVWHCEGSVVQMVERSQVELGVGKVSRFVTRVEPSVPKNIVFVSYLALVL